MERAETGCLKIKGDQHQHSHEKSGDVTIDLGIKNFKIKKKGN